MTVRLFGNAPSAVKTVEIQQPSEFNVQSLNDPSLRPRFDHPTFVTPSDFDSDGLYESPRKKQKRDREDLERLWREAVTDMALKKAEEDVNDVDELPEVASFAFAYGPTSKGRGKAQRKSESISDEEDMDSDSDSDLEPIYVERWSPPPADDTLTIPGELILARESRAKTTYWPAKILQYIPPKKRSEDPKYLVEFLDEFKGSIPRSLFHTTDDDQFATCIVRSPCCATC